MFILSGLWNVLAQAIYSVLMSVASVVLSPVSSCSFGSMSIFEDIYSVSSVF